ncbi:IS200/IS605 family transposase [Defluviimonas salinarum]|uniref:IS200/IS605 family transposase n=1 Tax=Defluviimonas salinarum TaxID=2992147 RepID=A0ABT3J863_9RHOB|nr:IS200/IS605 family transposase [Defluviimonas salinarum]MCW3783877.1 IS200/IS605 family transposase [Defluviimonas salinarum]
MTDFRAGRHVVHLLHAHLVLTTKYRRRAIETGRVRALLGETMAAACGDMGAELLACEADGDHVHLLVAYPPQLALSRLVNVLKGVSSRRLRQQGWPEVRRCLWGEAFWSPSYCVVSCGGAPLDVVKAYVESQNAPGRIRTGAVRRAAAREEKRRREENRRLDPSLKEGGCG